MRARVAPIAAALLLGTGCAGSGDRHTLARLHRLEPNLEEVRVEDGLDRAMGAYRDFLDQSPESALTPEAMRRLADLKLEKEYGVLGDATPRELPAPQVAQASARDREAAARPAPASLADLAESERDFERRASAPQDLAAAGPEALALPGGGSTSSEGPLEAIGIYDEILSNYPDYVHNDQVLYQKARALDELGRNDEAVQVIERLVSSYPHSRYLDEVQFRRAEYFFVRRRYLDAEASYLAVTRRGPGSEYYELALYKLGWTFYKQELHEEALDQYVALLDHKVATGYDFEQRENESDERRIADTFRVISLSFSSLGGPESVRGYFSQHGPRGYEDRIYRHLGEFYLEKLRYQDAADAYGAFVSLYPLHREAPHFGMRIVEIYETGDFPKLVLESKKDFAARYRLGAAYWSHFDPAEAPEVLAYLKDNLEDLAQHYHALYQEPEQPEHRPAHFAEAVHWYRAYLGDFPRDGETPAVHDKLAGLLLENEDFGGAAREYERVAYGYDAHPGAAAAGYAAIFAHREQQKRAEGGDREEIRRSAVESTLRFVAGFPAHEHAAVVLGAAVDDLYQMGEHERAIAQGHRLLEEYPQASGDVRRAAWAAIAHASLDLGRYPEAEAAYARVLEATGAEEEGRQATVDALAAAIYKQGEQAGEAGDHRAAADHFLRITRAAPDSAIRAAAEYDAGAALMKLEDWDGATAVFESFRASHPGHPLEGEATQRIASIHRQQGALAEAAAEYERVAAGSDEPELRSEALLAAGELYEESGRRESALAVYLRWVEQFPDPPELAAETRFRIAALHAEAGDEDSRREQLREIVRLEERAGAEHTPRLRFLAAKSALLLSETLYQRFAEVRLVQPFDRQLQEKQRRMQKALDGFEALVDYEVAEVTAAATYYMAEVFRDFSLALLESERPEGLAPEERAEYDAVLEEEAYPFEERAIAVHEKNLELMGAGVFNPWVEKSLGQLAELVPGRYAKAEASSGWLESPDHYAYRAPAASSPAADSEPEELAAGGAPIGESAW